MAIAIVNTTNATVAAAGTTGITVTKPGSLANGHVMYAFISRTDYALTNKWTCSGWTDIGPATHGFATGNDTELTILRKVVTNAGGEPANYTFVNTHATSYQICGFIVALSGVDNTTPEDITVQAYGQNSNAPNPASLNATSATADVFAIAVLQESLLTAAAVTPVAPSTYTLITNGNANSATGSLDNQTILASKTLGAAGSTTGTNAWANTGTTSTVETLTAVVLVRADVPKIAGAYWGAYMGVVSSGFTFWEPFTQANGNPAGWTLYSANWPQVVSNRLETAGWTSYEVISRSIGFTLPGDFELIYDGTAPLISGNGGMHVGVMDVSTNNGYSVFISNATHLYRWDAGVQSTMTNTGRPGEGGGGLLQNIVRMTYEAASDTFRAWLDGVQINNAVSSTHNPATWTAGNTHVFISIGNVNSPTQKSTLDSIMVARGIGNTYPP